MQIDAKNLSFSYNPKSSDLKVNALKNVTLSVEEGDFLGIIGQTGSGKTTFVRHLNGLIKVQKDSGKLTVGEFDLTDKKCQFKKLRAKVGMILQFPEYQLFAETVKSDVAFGLKNFFPEKTQEEIDVAVKQAIELVGLNYNEVADKSPFELSGGQKRRVAIAGVLVSKPEILVLDEPVAGLDPKGKREFLELINNLRKTFVKVIIIVSHDMNLVAEYCNKVAVFKDGEIVLFGDTEKVFSDSEKVIGAGLNLPLTAELTMLLSEKGTEINSDLTVEGFAKALAEKLGGKV